MPHLCLINNHWDNKCWYQGLNRLELLKIKIYRSLNAETKLKYPIFIVNIVLCNMFPKLHNYHNFFRCGRRYRIFHLHMIRSFIQYSFPFYLIGRKRIPDSRIVIDIWVTFKSLRFGIYVLSMGVCTTHAWPMNLERYEEMRSWFWACYNLWYH